MNYESEYTELLPNSDPEKRREYWEIAKGLQATDGLVTSAYLETVIKDTLTGKYDTVEASQKLADYYADLPLDSPEKDYREADKVAARITAFLEVESFTFSPIELKMIHKDLFRDFPEYKPGEYRKGNIAKCEAVLDGDSVRYADYDRITALLAYDFDRESVSRYNLPFASNQIVQLAKFVLGIWETHPFYEGNTRTVSTFLIKYLRSLSITINNDPFKENAGWFRDALVRANYVNTDKHIQSDQSFLVMFLENILTDADHDLESIDLHI